MATNTTAVCDVGLEQIPTLESCPSSRAKNRLCPGSSSPPKNKQRKNSFPQNDQDFCIAPAMPKPGSVNLLVNTPVWKSVESLAKEFRKMSDQGFLSNLAHPESKRDEVSQAIGREWLGESHPAMRALAIGVGTHRRL